MKDFTINLRQGLPEMGFGPATDIFNNVYLSLAVAKGSFFHNPEFGLRRRGRMKNTEATAALIRTDYIEALQWLLDIGRATSINVQVQRDRLQDLNRLKLMVTVVQASGGTVSVTTEYGGASGIVTIGDYIVMESGDRLITDMSGDQIILEGL